LIIEQENLKTQEKEEIVRIMDPNQTGRKPVYYKPQKIKFSDEILKLEHQKFLVDTGISGEPRQISIFIKIGKHKLKACIDTGASKTLISKEQWDKLDSPGLRIRPSNVSLVACGNKPIQVHGMERLKFKVTQTKNEYKWPFIISDSWSPNHDCILGLDFLAKVGAKIDLETNELIFRQQG